jgi:choline dehydrogenase
VGTPAQQLRATTSRSRSTCPVSEANLNDHTMTPIVWATKTRPTCCNWPPREHGPLAAARRGPFCSIGGDVGGFRTNGNDVLIFNTL